MLRTTRTADRVRTGLTWLGEWRLSGPERHASRAEREAEHQMRRERDNEHSETIRRAAVEAERQRWGGTGGPLHGG